MLQQISIFMENKPGRLYEATKILGDNNINIRTLSLADTSEFGIARLIVDKPELVTELLKDNNFTARLTPVLAIEVPDKPGGLAEVLKIFHELGANIEYMYGFVEKEHNDRALLIFKVENGEQYKDKLREKGLILVSKENIFK